MNQPRSSASPETSSTASRKALRHVRHGSAGACGLPRAASRRRACASRARRPRRLRLLQPGRCAGLWREAGPADPARRDGRRFRSSRSNAASTRPCCPTRSPASTIAPCTMQGLIPPEEAGGTGPGGALLAWHVNHRFCGRCGGASRCARAATSGSARSATPSTSRGPTRSRSCWP